MASRRGGIWLGAAARWRNDVAPVFGEVLTDVSGHSKGLQVRLGVEKEFRFGRFGMTPALAVNWLDRKYVDYYYGVAAGEALSSRPQYEGRSAVNTELGVRMRYTLTPRSAVTLDVGITRLGSGLTGSPLVDRSTTAKVGMGYVYRF